MKTVIANVVTVSVAAVMAAGCACAWMCGRKSLSLEGASC